MGLKNLLGSGGLIVALAVFVAAAANAQNRGTVEAAQAMVADAIALYDDVCPDEARRIFSKEPGSRFLDRDIYLFIVFGEGEVIAHVEDDEASWDAASTASSISTASTLPAR